MSCHEGVSCDSCLKNNFRGKRYKCLICYDYDLCSTCYEVGATTVRHTKEHPMQCILTRTDCELHYGGEVPIQYQAMSFTCPHCSVAGFNESTLLDHVTIEHGDSVTEVICPVCASMHGGDPNLVTDDFVGHMSVEHQSTVPRDLISFLDESVIAGRHRVRRIPARGAHSANRGRRGNSHGSSTGLTALSSSSHDSVDPIAELLSQLSGARRSATNASNANPNTSLSQQLQHIQMLQIERQQMNAARQQRHDLQIISVSNSHTPTTTVVGKPRLPYGAWVNKPENTQQPTPLPSTPPPTQNKFLLDEVFQKMASEPNNDTLRPAFLRQVLIGSLAKKEPSKPKTGRLADLITRTSRRPSSKGFMEDETTPTNETHENE